MALSEADRAATKAAIEAGKKLSGLTSLRSVIWWLLQEAVQTERRFSNREHALLTKLVARPQLAPTAIERWIEERGRLALLDTEHELANEVMIAERGAVDRYLVVMSWLNVVNDRSRQPARDKAITLDFARRRRVAEIRNRYMRQHTDRAVELVRDRVLVLVERHVAENVNGTSFLDFSEVFGKLAL